MEIVGASRERVLSAAGVERASEIEAESRSWMMTCSKCGTDQSVWDLGGVRYAASSASKRSLVRCVTCRRRFFAKIERR